LLNFEACRWAMGHAPCTFFMVGVPQRHAK
jgi:hypothetical protein